MRRLMTLAAVLVAGPAPAQTDPAPKDGRVTVPLLLSPAAAPVPANRYAVYPNYLDRQPGERVGGLLRCFMEWEEFFDKANTEKRLKQLDGPLTAVSDDILGIGGIAYGQPYARRGERIDRGARFHHVEWNEHHGLRHDGIYLLIPEVQRMRDLSHVIRLRMRAEVKAGQWDKAVESAKTLFAIAQTLEQHPTLIGCLVGIAVAHAALHSLEELSAQPGAPSLFWALADLPRPLVSTRNGFAGERLFVKSHYGELLQTRRPLSDTELDRWIKLTTDIFQTDPDSSKKEPHKTMLADPKGWFARAVADPARMAEARKRIVTTGGFPPAVADALPPVQVGLLDDLLLFEELREEAFKWANLPRWRAAPDIKAADDALRQSRPALIFTPYFLPAVNKVKDAETRLTLRAAQLGTAEAIRLHANATGKLPASLDEIKLPLPLNPYTNKPLTYSLADGVATLGSEVAPEGGDKVNRWYEIRLSK